MCAFIGVIVSLILFFIVFLIVFLLLLLPFIVCYCWYSLIVFTVSYCFYCFSLPHGWLVAAAAAAGAAEQHGWLNYNLLSIGWLLCLM